MAPDDHPSAPGLSRRGNNLVAESGFPEYLVEQFRLAADAWHPDANPDGYLGLCVAENRLVWDLLEAEVRAARDVPPEAFAYDAMIGSERFRGQLAAFLSRHVLGRSVGADRLAVLAGAGSVLEILFHAIADPGDGVLVPTPSYAGFWLDLETRDELTIVPVHCPSDDGFRLTPERLDAAVEAAGRPVKALLYTNPDNPRGAVASRDDLEAILRWSADRGVHLVCDEVYALSVFGERDFTSVAALRPSLGPSVHVVWAFSKDFAASGLRCGVLVTENPDVLRAVDTLAYWACCSGDTQHLLGSMISDEAWLVHYLTEMPRRLGEAYRRTTDALGATGIAYVPAEAGFFLLVDLRRFLAAPTFEAEHALWRRLLDEAGVNLTPGAACRIAEPGFMRLCFAAAPPVAVEEAVRRIGRVLVDPP
jgi:aspartate/methionine/tyrosine aminotransferase